MREATLYYPLYLACRGITEAIKNPDALDEGRGRALFSACAKTLDEIVYTSGSIIHLKRTSDLKIFLSMKSYIDENLEFIEGRNWAAGKQRFNSEKLKEYANTLLSRCKKEVKEIRDLPE